MGPACGGGWDSSGWSQARVDSSGWSPLAPGVDWVDSPGRSPLSVPGPEDDEEGPLAPLFSPDGFEQFVKNLQSKPLRETIGHTPVQVAFGALTGVVIGVIVGLNSKIEHSSIFKA